MSLGPCLGAHTCLSIGTASSCFEQVLNFPSFVECIPLNVVRMGILYVKPNSKPFLYVNSFSFTTLKSRYIIISIYASGKIRAQTG